MNGWPGSAAISHSAPEKKCSSLVRWDKDIGRNQVITRLEVELFLYVSLRHWHHDLHEIQPVFFGLQWLQCARNKHKAVLFTNPLGKACYELNQERVNSALFRGCSFRGFVFFLIGGVLGGYMPQALQVPCSETGGPQLPRLKWKVTRHGTHDWTRCSDTYPRNS